MKTIYLIRHSAPFVEIDNYVDNDNVLWFEFNKNMILSPQGEENARKLCNVKELKDIDEIYASNSSRAIETAKYLAEYNNLKIKLDERINEREFGVDYINDLPEDFTKISFEDKTFKVNNGESLNDVDNRFKSFIKDLLDKENNRIAIVMHGIILLSYLKTICNHFEFDGENFNIKYNDNIVLDGKPKNPSIYKVVFDSNQKIINVEYVECDLQ
jgi:hypothetical protein